MNELLIQLQQPLTIGATLLVVAVGLSAMFAMWHSAVTARRDLGNIWRGQQPAESRTHRGPRQATSELEQALEHARRTPGEHKGDRIVLSASPQALLREWIDDVVLAKWRFEAGPWLTGLALMCTFLLIALVLAKDVGPAISGGSEAGMKQLASGVSTMGAKFIVSVAGIFMSIVHGMLRAHWVSRLNEDAAATAERVANHVVSVDDLLVENALKSEGLMIAQNQMLEEGFAGLGRAIGGLNSIDVSVKNIGTELQSTLSQVVRRDIVEKMQRNMQEIADQFAETINSSITEQVTEITAALQKIEAAVVGQAQGQVEELLHKLSDAVSGGFESESSRMKDALTRFADVVPQLELQMRTMMNSAEQDMARHGEASTRANDALIQKLESVLASMLTQQQSSAEVSQRMEQFVLQTQTTMSAALADASDQITERSRLSLGELQGAMRSATDDAATVYQDLVKEVQGAATLLKDARTDAVTGASQLRDSTVAMHDVLTEMRESIRGAGQLSSAMSSAVQDAQAVVERGTIALQASEQAISEQQRFVNELASRWPSMTKQYIESADEVFGRVAAAWKEQSETIGASVRKISDAFGSSITDFAGAVEDLEAQVDKLVPERAASRTPLQRA